MTDTDTSRGRIHSLNISKGGVPKRTIERVPVTRLGLVGDKHNNTRLHGGPERAVCLYSVELMRRLNAEGHNIAPGSLGENVTLEGVDTTALEPGDVLRLGPEVVLQISATLRPAKRSPITSPAATTRASPPSCTPARAASTPASSPRARWPSVTPSLR